MLKVLKLLNPYKQITPRSGKVLFDENRTFNFVIEAPLYWWVDVDRLKYGWELKDFSEEERRTMSIATPVKAVLSLPYQDIVELCEDYACGVYKFEDEPYRWSNEREWNDLCETLLDICGVRDLVKEATV